MWAAVARRLGERLGRRGALLTLKGTIAVLYGYGQIIQPVPDQRGLHLLLKVMPIDAWGGTWIAAGAIALVCAWLPQLRDWPGFLAVWLIGSAWAMAYLVAWWPLDVGAAAHTGGIDYYRQVTVEDTSRPIVREVNGK
ncbi:hypothetical protein, partial [Streptomyces sp. NPDC056650]|uniref:hypothetical protein n=1 Tax=Streptomyces sp. NPDC056650 TaxID=3154856 RepID=UPI0034372D2F